MSYQGRVSKRFLWDLGGGDSPKKKAEKAALEAESLSCSFREPTPLCKQTLSQAASLSGAMGTVVVGSEDLTFFLLYTWER